MIDIIRIVSSFIGSFLGCSFVYWCINNIRKNREKELFLIKDKQLQEWYKNTMTDIEERRILIKQHRCPQCKLDLESSIVNGKHGMFQYECKTCKTIIMGKRSFEQRIRAIEQRLGI